MLHVAHGTTVTVLASGLRLAVLLVAARLSVLQDFHPNESPSSSLEDHTPTTALEFALAMGEYIAVTLLPTEQPMRLGGGGAFRSPVSALVAAREGGDASRAPSRGGGPTYPSLMPLPVLEATLVMQCGLGVPALLEAADAMAAPAMPSSSSASSSTTSHAQQQDGGSAGGAGGGLEVGREEPCDDVRYFCPICMLNFSSVHSTACCHNYLCSRCALQYVYNKVRVGMCVCMCPQPSRRRHSILDVSCGLPSRRRVRRCRIFSFFQVLSSGQRARPAGVPG